MRVIRLFLILLIGGLLIYLEYKTKYQTFITDIIIWLGLLLFGILILIWTIIKDVQLFRINRRVISFELTFLCLLFISIILALGRVISNDFNKPTLLKVFYTGDYNGTGIDFKTDGTYIFESSAIGFIQYFYGIYQIDLNKITLDKDTIDNLINLRHLEIREKKIEYYTGDKNVLYLFQVNASGDIFERTTEFKVILDNRTDEYSP